MAQTRKTRNNSRPMCIRNDQGIALLELILAISVGVLVSIAVSTVMLMGLRMFNRSNEAARHRNQVLTGITIMENLVTESSGLRIEETTKGVAICDDEKVLLTYHEENRAVYSGAETNGAPILEDVDEFCVTVPGTSLMRVVMKVQDQEYSFFLFARDAATQAGETSVSVQKFLEVLRSQLGSDEDRNYGFIRENGIDTSTHYATWYDSTWGPNTPWCSCFVSWALAKVNGFVADTQTPRYASVNTFMKALVDSNAWAGKADVPDPGDLIFFDWEPGLPEAEELDHVGVVEKVENGYVYTIEGNSGGSGTYDGWVRQKVYSLNSPYIAGYGKINWIG